MHKSDLYFFLFLPHALCPLAFAKNCISLRFFTFSISEPSGIYSHENFFFFFFLLNTEISLPYGLVVIHGSKKVRNSKIMYALCCFLWLGCNIFLLLVQSTEVEIGLWFIQLDAYLFKATIDSSRLERNGKQERKKKGGLSLRYFFLLV